MWSRGHWPAAREKRCPLNGVCHREDDFRPHTGCMARSKVREMQEDGDMESTLVDGQPQGLPATGKRSRWRALMGEDRRFWLFAAWVFGVLSFLKGIRFPESWEYTQAQIDYRHGFIKRGLFGAVVTKRLHLQHYSTFTIFSFIALGIAVLSLIQLAKQSRLRDRVGDGEVLAVFFASFSMTYMANMNGALDILLIALTIALLLIRKPGVRFLAAVPVVTVALLLHEGFLVLFFPWLLFSFLVEAMGERENRRRIALMSAGLILWAVVLTVAVALRPSMTAAGSEAFRVEIGRQTDFPLRVDFFDVLNRSTKDNVRLMMHHLNSPLYLIVQWAALVIFLPTAAVLVVIARRLLQLAPQEGLRKYGFPALLAVAISPLLMHGVGWDAARWDSYACLSAFIALLLVARVVPGKKLTLGPAMRNAMILTIALSMISGDTLLSVWPNLYPYVQPLRAFRSYMQAKHGEQPSSAGAAAHPHQK